MTVLRKWIWESRGKEVSLKVNFNTVVERNERFWEQRRALHDTPYRLESSEFIEWDLNQQKFINDLRQACLSVLAVPVFTECVHPIYDLQGLSTIETEENLESFWNMHNCEILLVKSLSQDLSELKLISQVNNNSIVVSSPIAGDYRIGDTAIYSCFPGIIQSKNLIVETNKMVSAKIEFKEVFLEWSLS